MVLQNELKAMCSNKTSSFLRGENNALELEEFRWEKLLAELQMNAPVFLSLLYAATYAQQKRKYQNAVIGICAAIILSIV